MEGKSKEIGNGARRLVFFLSVSTLGNVYMDGSSGLVSLRVSTKESCERAIPVFKLIFSWFNTLCFHDSLALFIAQARC